MSTKSQVRVMTNPINNLSPKQRAVLEYYGPFFAAVGLDAADFSEAELYEKLPTITEDPAVKKLWRTKYDVYMKSAKRALAVEQDDYQNMIPSIDILIAAAREQPPVVKAAIRQHVLAKKA